MVRRKSAGGKGMIELSFCVLDPLNERLVRCGKISGLQRLAKDPLYSFR